MSALKGIFEELKKEINSELDKVKQNSSSNDKASIEKIQKMFLGSNTSVEKKHHRDYQGVNRPQTKNVSNNNATMTQRRIAELSKKTNYEKDKASAYNQKKKVFNQSFDSKHANSKQFSKSIRNRKPLIGEEGGASTIFADDISKSDMTQNDISKLTPISEKNISQIGKEMRNPENAKKAFIASIIFERR